MKKKLFMLLLTLLAVVCVFVSCGDDEGGVTTPSVNNNNTTGSSSISGGDANCTHDFKVTSTVNATCAADGKEISTCSKCGATSERTLNKINEHTMSYEETAPTCSAPGLVIGTCTVCGYTTETEGKPALGHSGQTLVTEIVTYPTCTEPGLQRQVCSDCGEPQWSAGFKSEIDALGHTYSRTSDYFSEEAGVTYVPAGCGVDGYFARVCKDCGFDGDPITREMYKNLENKANSGYSEKVYQDMKGAEHAFNEEIGQILATCTEPLYVVYKCENCTEETKVPYGKAVGHRYNDSEDGEEGTAFVIDPKPTCVTEGVKTYLCTVCGVPSEDENYIVSVPMLEHDTSKRTNEYLLSIVKADCENPTRKTYKCCNGNCDVVEVVEEGAPLGHEWVVSGTASCATGGLTPYMCTRCKAETNFEDENSIPLEEAIHSGKMIKEPTCVKNAVYKCDSCGSEFGPYEGDPKYADGFKTELHYLELAETVDPTCSSIGYNIYRCTNDETCTVWGVNDNINKLDTPKAGTTTPRLPHDFVREGGKIVVSPDGTISCKNCSLKYRDINTEKKSGTSSLCVSKECVEGACQCNVTVEWATYVTPKDAEILSENVRVEKTSTTWSDGTVVDLAIGKGAIAINGKDESTYVVEIYDSNGKLLHTFNGEGSKFYIDLYEYEDVAKVCVKSSTKATVRYCQLAD